MSISIFNRLTCGEHNKLTRQCLVHVVPLLTFFTLCGEVFPLYAYWKVQQNTHVASPCTKDQDGYVRKENMAACGS